MGGPANCRYVCRVGDADDGAGVAQPDTRASAAIEASSPAKVRMRISLKTIDSTTSDRSVGLQRSSELGLLRCVGPDDGVRDKLPTQVLAPRQRGKFSQLCGVRRSIRIELWIGAQTDLQRL